MYSNYIPYPDLDDVNFYKKIYHKKEFYDTKPPPLPKTNNQSDKTMNLLFKEGSDFKLQSQQIFLKNFISESTPYRGVFIWHGTGTGKTCASIVIAERFHRRVEETSKRVLMIVNRTIQNEFYKTIFNFEKEASKSSRQVVQCTGSTYKLGSDSKYLSSKKQEVHITKMIKDIYEITTKDSLRNKLLKETGWDGIKETINDNIKNKIKEIYSDRVIIVDEAHNRVGSSGLDMSVPTILEAIVSYANNIRLILMSATPMVNSNDDIIFPLNLLRLNDRRPTFKRKSIFKPDGEFTKGGEALLKEMCRGYISYVRGGDPPRFPYKLIAPESSIPNPKYLFNGELIQDSKKIKHTKVIKCEMSIFQYNTYNKTLKNDIKLKIGGLLTGASQSGNIVFPTSDSNTDGEYGKNGYGSVKNDNHSLNIIKDSRGNTVYQYSSFSQGFLLRENINKYSTKFAKIYDNIISSRGIAYVYSNWIEGGMLTLSLMFEENGFEPAIITGFEHIRFNSNTKKPLICYMCCKFKHGPEDHIWSSAKYVLLTGSLELSKSDLAKISGYINRKENMDGKLVKVLLGTAVSGEGIDFKRIRQVHILEPWFNQARLDQVEGRSIRNGSHKDLPPEQRNVEIFKYCTIQPKSLNKKEESIETNDEHNYRIIEDKDKQIKKVEYILKESAIDCMFQRDNNIRNIHRTIKLEDSRGNIINYVSGDIPYSRECNYMKSCNYKCDWEPKNNKDIVINKSTYGLEFADVDIEKAREYIYKMYKINPVIDVNTIFKTIKNENPNIEDIYIYLALESLMDRKGSYAINDKYGRDGYLVERGDLYIYQPFELYNYNAPIIYKVNPLETKPEDIPFSATDIKKIENLSELKISGLEIFNEYFKQYENTKKILQYYVKKIEKYENIIIDIVIFQLSDIETLELLKYIMSPLYKKNKNKEIEKFRTSLIDYYINSKKILNNNKTLAVMSGNLCSQWGRSRFGAKKTITDQWGKCDADSEALLTNEINSYNYSMLWKKVSSDKRLHEYESISRSEYIFILKQDGIRPEYIGTVEEKIKGGKKYLKILDFTKGEYINVISKRKEMRGRVCTSLFGPLLKVILNNLETKVNKLNLQNIKIPANSSQKISRLNMCLKIEFLFRLLNDSTKDVWFYNSNFSLDDIK